MEKGTKRKSTKIKKLDKKNISSLHYFPYKKLKLELHWLDAKSKTGWSTKEELKELKPAKCITSGWVFEETKHYIKTFSTYSLEEDGTIEFGEILVIPKKWIIN